jgi:hypothetical protein
MPPAGRGYISSGRMSIIDDEKECIADPSYSMRVPLRCSFDWMGIEDDFASVGPPRTTCFWMICVGLFKKERYACGVALHEVRA